MNPVSRRAKIIAYVGVWLLALFVTNPNAGLLPLIYMFPLGLAAVFFPPSLRDGGWGYFVGCYLVYLIHAVFFFRTRVRQSTYLCFGILVLLLICNIAGCRRMIDTH